MPASSMTIPSMSRLGATRKLGSFRIKKAEYINVNTVRIRDLWLISIGFVLRFSIAASFVSSISPATEHYIPVPRSTSHSGTSGVRSCADPSPLATASHRQPNWERPNRVRSRRAGPLFQYGTKPGDPYGKTRSFFPPSPGPDRKLFPRVRRCSTPGDRTGERTGLPAF